MPSSIVKNILLTFKVQFSVLNWRTELYRFTEKNWAFNMHVTINYCLPFVNEVRKVNGLWSLISINYNELTEAVLMSMFENFQPVN